MSMGTLDLISGRISRTLFFDRRFRSEKRSMAQMRRVKQYSKNDTFQMGERVLYFVWSTCKIRPWSRAVHHSDTRNLDKKKCSLIYEYRRQSRSPLQR